MRLAYVMFASLLSGAPALAGEAAARATLCVDDLRLRVPAAAVLPAADVVAELFRDAGVAIEWTHNISGERAAGICGRGTLSATMILGRARPEGRNTRALAETGVGQRLTTVYYEAVERYARSRHVPVPVMLGYVMAHEIGHVLMGVDHAAGGIMRAEWTQDEVCRMTSGHLRFDEAERTYLHVMAGRLESAGGAALRASSQYAHIEKE